MCMGSYIIQGGKPLSGEVTASGNKNAALPCIAATLLTDEAVVLKNLPEIEDVHIMFKILQGLGSEVKRLSPGTYQIQTGDISGTIDEVLADLIRASILFAGPLLGRVGKVALAPPGGDIIGLRRLDTHFLAFEALGAVSQVTNDRYIVIEAATLTGSDIFLDEASVTATENAVMAAVLAGGKTVIRNAASEPHVQDLCRMLSRMGAEITGIGSNLIHIAGVPRLGGCEYTIGSDYMEIGSYIGLAAATGGEITIHGVQLEHLPMIRLGYKKLGITWVEQGQSLHVPAHQSRVICTDVSGMMTKIDDAPWPGFPADLLSIITVIATQMQGTVLVHEKMFESRMFFVDMLIRMGAFIVLCDPHRAVISGPSRLHGALVTSPDVRAGMALVIAALSADGRSEIQNVFQIERGYEDLCGKLHALGANIVRKD